MSEMINIVGLSKAAVLAALYNASRPQGLGFINYNPEPMSESHAQELLDQGTYFDYIAGRVMKVDLESDEEFDPRLYDRDNGEGAAEHAISALRMGGINTPAHQRQHASGMAEAAQVAREHMHEPTTMRGNALHLGSADVADVLAPAIDKAVGAPND